VPDADLSCLFTGFKDWAKLLEDEKRVSQAFLATTLSCVVEVTQPVPEAVRTEECRCTVTARLGRPRVF